MDWVLDGFGVLKTSISSVPSWKSAAKTQSEVLHGRLEISKAGDRCENAMDSMADLRFPMGR